MTDESATPHPLGEFLRARRALVDPSEHGVRDVGRRRVPGLRREELIFLAGVSAPYYARLEQGRDRAPSPEVLEAIAQVLRLDTETAAHPHRLAAPPARRYRRHAGSPERVPPLVLRLLQAWPGSAVLVVGAHRDVLAANDLAVALNPGFAPGRNLVRDTFLDPRSRELHTDWDDVAASSVAGLRASAGLEPDDPALTGLVGELRAASEEFRALWARHEVYAKTSGRKRHHHPLVGDLELDYQTLTVNGEVDQSVHVFSAPPGTPSADAMALLEAGLAEPLESARPATVPTPRAAPQPSRARA